MALLFLKSLFSKETCDSIASGLRMSSFLWPNNCSMPEATSNSPMHGDAQQQPMAFKEVDNRSKIELCFEQKLSAMKGSIVWSCVRMWLPFSAMNTPCCHQGKTLQIKATKALQAKKNTILLWYVFRSIFRKQTRGNAVIFQAAYVTLPVYSSNLSMFRACGLNLTLM